MNATLYRHLSDRNELIQLEAGKTVKENFPDIDFENSVILINGKKAPPESVVNEKDIVIIRKIPAALSTMAIVAIVGVVIAIGIGVGVGIYAYEQQKKLDAELEKLKKQSNNDKIDNRPFLKGASNSIATGKSQPYICGRHLFTPYLLSYPFYKISGSDGTDQYYYAVLECGFNKQILEQIKVEDVIIKNFTDNVPQQGMFEFNSDSIFYSPESKIEIIQDGGAFSTIPELNIKTVAETANKQIPYADQITDKSKTPLQFTIAENAKSVDVVITFNNGLFGYNDDNDKITTSIEIIPEYSLNDGKDWTPFLFDQNGTKSNTFTRNAQKEIRFTAHHDFTATDVADLEKPVLIQVRTTAKKDSKKTNACYVMYVQSTCFDAAEWAQNKNFVDCKVVEDRERAFCTMLGIRIKATEANEDKLNKINVITQSIARTWDGTAWSAGKTTTRNPAAILLEVLTSDSHPASKFYDDEIDLPSFGDLHEYCGQNEYRFDKVIADGVTKQDTINLILTACDSVMYWNIHGKLAIATDTVKENTMSVFNSQNILSIENKKEFKRRTDGLRVKFINGAAGFAEDSYLVMRTGATLSQDSVLREITVEGITEYRHVVKYARRLMASESLRPKLTTIQIGHEGVFFTPYSKLLLQDDSLKIGLSSGTIQSVQTENGFITALTLYDAVEFLPNYQYGMVVNCVNEDTAAIISVKVIGTGITKNVNILEPLPVPSPELPKIIPSPGDTFSFGLLNDDGGFNKITSPFLITSMRKTDSGYSLDLVDYNEALYDTGDIPEYKSNISNRPSNNEKKITDTVTKEELDSRLENIKIEGLTVEYSVNGNGNWHGVYNENDKYMRQSIDGGKNWSDAIRLTGLKGEPGATIKMPDMSRCVLFLSCDDVVGTYAINNAKKDSIALISGGKQVSGLSGLALQFEQNEGVQYKALPPLQSMSLSVFFKLDSYGVITQQTAQSMLIRVEADKLTVFPDPAGSRQIAKQILLNTWYCVIYIYDNSTQKEYVRLYRYILDTAGRLSIGDYSQWEFDAVRDFETPWELTIESATDDAAGTIDALRIDSYPWDIDEADGWAYVKGVTTKLYTAADYNNSNINEIVSDSTPRYLGALISDPVTYGKIGDWYAYRGENTEERKKGKCYKKVSHTFWVFDNDIAHNMQAMQDLLTISRDELATNTDIPAVQFLNTLVASKAFINEGFINSLFANNIELQEGGEIKSKEFSPAVKGFRLKYNGDLDVTTGNFRDISIGGNSIISSTMMVLPRTQKDIYGASVGEIWLRDDL